MIKKFNLENNSFNRLFMFGFTIVVLVVSILTPPFNRQMNLNILNELILFQMENSF